MYPIELRLDIYALLILLGVFQGFFLSFFFLTGDNRKIYANRVYGFLILTLAFLTLENWLNYTGFITRAIFIDNFSEPMNFAIAPLAYIYVRAVSAYPFRKRDAWHFLIFVFYFFYCFQYFFQTDEFKFNSFIDVIRPELQKIDAQMLFDDDPLGIRRIVNELTFVHFIIYLSLSLQILVKEGKKRGENLINLKNSSLRWARNTIFHFIIISLIFVSVKLYFGRDLGDYIIGVYIAFIIYLTSIFVIKGSTFFKPESVVTAKYTKSSLDEEQKRDVLTALETIMKDEGYYLNNRANLPDLSKKIGWASHHVSQVINEKLDKSFFEWIAEQRIQKVCELLKVEENSRITIEDLAERVGYNSKSSFNKAFKRYTKQTPSQYRTSK